MHAQFEATRPARNELPAPRWRRLHRHHDRRSASTRRPAQLHRASLLPVARHCLHHLGPRLLLALLPLRAPHAARQPVNGPLPGKAGRCTAHHCANEARGRNRSGRTRPRRHADGTAPGPAAARTSGSPRRRGDPHPARPEEHPGHGAVGLRPPRHEQRPDRQGARTAPDSVNRPRHHAGNQHAEIRQGRRCAPQCRAATPSPAGGRGNACSPRRRQERHQLDECNSRRLPRPGRPGSAAARDHQHRSQRRAGAGRKAGCRHHVDGTGARWRDSHRHGRQRTRPARGRAQEPV